MPSSSTKKRHDKWRIDEGLAPDPMVSAPAAEPEAVPRLRKRKKKRAVEPEPEAEAPPEEDYDAD